jgi:hypothetical protein
MHFFFESDGTLVRKEILDARSGHVCPVEQSSRQRNVRSVAGFRDGLQNLQCCGRRRSQYLTRPENYFWSFSTRTSALSSPVLLCFSLPYFPVLVSRTSMS